MLTNIQVLESKAAALRLVLGDLWRVEAKALSEFFKVKEELWWARRKAEEKGE